MHGGSPAKTPPTSEMRPSSMETTSMPTEVTSAEVTSSEVTSAKVATAMTTAAVAAAVTAPMPTAASCRSRARKRKGQRKCNHGQEFESRHDNLLKLPSLTPSASGTIGSTPRYNATSDNASRA
jgi:hypothetical protein